MELTPDWVLKISRSSSSISLAIAEFKYNKANSIAVEAELVFRPFLPASGSTGSLIVLLFFSYNGGLWAVSWHYFKLTV